MNNVSWVETECALLVILVCSVWWLIKDHVFTVIRDIPEQ